MASTTPIYAWPYQQADDPPDGAALGEDLALAVEATVDAIDDRVDVLEASKTGQVIKRHNRSGNVTLGTTGETGVIRLDSVPVFLGRMYSIRAPRLRYDVATTTDRGKWHLRMNTAGTATTSSTIRARSEVPDQDSTSLEWIYVPAADETLSVLLSILKVSGTSTFTAVGADEGGIDFLVQDIGPAVASSGVNV